MLSCYVSSIHSLLITGRTLVELTGLSGPDGVRSAAQAGTYLRQNSSNMDEPLASSPPGFWSLGDSRLSTKCLSSSDRVKRRITDVKVGAGRPATAGDSWKKIILIY